MTNIDEMVNRFLCWKLPADFSPDCGISFKRESDYEHPEFGRTKYEPTGTNLLTAEQAKNMFTHCIGPRDHNQRISELEAEVDHLRSVANTAITFLRDDA